MSETPPMQAETSAGADPEASGWRVRVATRKDVSAIVAAVGELLAELGGQAPAPDAMEAAARDLIDNCDTGALLVAGADDELVGVLAASWQTAIHAPGRYALIQDLWVKESWRSRAVGAALLAALFELAGEWGVSRVEVGLPRESFANIRATEAFYERNGFSPLGPRMRRVLG